MTIKLFDLPGAEPDPRFGPYCWRSKLALARKGLALEAIPWLCRKGRRKQLRCPGRAGCRSCLRFRSAVNRCSGAGSRDPAARQPFFCQIHAT
jgi:hypothetical protein